MDAVIPLDDFIAKDGGQEYIDDFIPAFMKNSYYDGKTYSIPFQRSTIIMYYNKDQFKEAGLDPEKPPTNWDELREYAKKLTVTDASGNVSRWGVMIPMDDPFMFYGFCRQNSNDPQSQIMAEDGKSVYFDTPENAEAPAVPGGSGAGGQGDARGLHQVGRRSVQLYGRSHLHHLHLQRKPDQYSGQHGF